MYIFVRVEGDGFGRWVGVHFTGVLSLVGEGGKSARVREGERERQRQ